MPSFEKSIGAMVCRMVDKQPFFLLLHYPSGHWDFPKGHQEEGETDEETLKREVEEETGIVDLKFFGDYKKTVRYRYTAVGKEAEKRKQTQTPLNIFKRVVYYMAETKTETVKISSEHVGYQWLNYEETLKKITFPETKKVMQFLFLKLNIKLP